MAIGIDPRPFPRRSAPSTTALDALRSTYSNVSRMSRSEDGRLDSSIQDENWFLSAWRQEPQPQSALWWSSPPSHSAHSSKAESGSAFGRQPLALEERQHFASKSSHSETSLAMTSSGPPPGVPCLGTSSHQLLGCKAGLRWEPTQIVNEEIPTALESMFFPLDLSFQTKASKTPQKLLIETPKKAPEVARDDERNHDVTPPKDFDSSSTRWQRQYFNSVLQNTSDASMRCKPSPAPNNWNRSGESPLYRSARDAKGVCHDRGEASSSDGTCHQLAEFTVTSPRCSKELASCSMDDLPASLRNALTFVSNLPEFPCTKFRTPLLPPSRSDTQLRPTLVLDLDETLVHCSRGCSSRVAPSSIYRRDHIIVQFDENSSACGYVGFRPYVHTFLRTAARHFEIVVFTASQQSYADKVIDALDPGGNFVQHRLYRQHCTEFRGAFFKELHLLGRSPHQCFLVDNSPISAACNWDNSILIKSWYDDENDRELCDLLQVFHDMLTNGANCDRYLANRYGLRDFFNALRSRVRRAP